MTKLDFSGVKDARVGEREVQRIYRGDTKVWNKYCWEKWACETVYTASLSSELTGQMLGVYGYEKITNGLQFKTRTSLASAGYYYFSNSMEGGNTVADAYDQGYVYRITDTDRQVYEGETYLKATGSSYDSKSIRIIDFTQYKVKRTYKFSRYEKGSKSYGVVEGYSGDYPDNGRHSDGYWYVRVDPVGVKEG